jgi:hypothetical protein
MPLRIATGYEKLALDLEEHIRFYKPFKHRTAISDFDVVPSFSAEDARNLMHGYKHDSLEETFERLTQKHPYQHLDRYYFRQAIHDFFEKGLYGRSFGKSITTLR